MTDDDLTAIQLAVNIAVNLLSAGDKLTAVVRDLDGDYITSSDVTRWQTDVGLAIDALCRTKFVPDVALHKLFLIIQSD